MRLYEEWELIPKAKRKENGYRVFTDFHLEQIRLVRLALRVEVVQNGLRKKAIAIIKTSALGDFDRAICLAQEYLGQIKLEERYAEEALFIAKELLSGDSHEANTIALTRKETAEHLQITIDALRNWEMNGLLSVKRKQNGYRIYTNEDIRRLKLIRSLRCANYSLSAILRMLHALSENPKTDIRQAIDTPQKNETIISVCDELLTSLHDAEENAEQMLAQLKQMQKQFHTNPPL